MKKLFFTAALIATFASHATDGNPVLVSDANKILDQFEEHHTVDFGDDTGRRMVHAARKKGQPWHLLVYAQRAAGRWEMTADIAVAENTKGLIFAGTSEESELSPGVTCTADGRRQAIFGWMTPDYKAKTLDVIWTLDDKDRPVPVAGMKVACQVG